MAHEHTDDPRKTQKKSVEERGWINVYEIFFCSCGQSMGKGVEPISTKRAPKRK